MSLQARFILDVAASATDSSNSYWGISRVNWSFNGSGIVENIAAWLPWTGDKTAQVVIPNAWAYLTAPTEEDPNPSQSIFNVLGQKVTFTATQG